MRPFVGFGVWRAMDMLAEYGSLIVVGRVGSREALPPGLPSWGGGYVVLVWAGPYWASYVGGGWSVLRLLLRAPGIFRPGRGPPRGGARCPGANLGARGWVVGRFAGPAGSRPCSGDDRVGGRQRGRPGAPLSPGGLGRIVARPVGRPPGLWGGRERGVLLGYVVREWGIGRGTVRVALMLDCSGVLAL